MSRSDYCGCCGREIENSSVGEPWCRDCRDHALPPALGRAPWDRTYYAQHGMDCPLQEPAEFERDFDREAVE
jgi:hypothetical protein